MSKKPRPVQIQTTTKGHFVAFLDRKPGQKFNAAFFSLDFSEEKVREWIAANPKIYLQP